MIYSQDLQQYLEDFSSPEDEILYQLRRESNLKAIYPQMLSGPVQGKFLELVSRMLQPNLILEIGTFTGYSTLCLAKGLAQGGKIYSIERNDELRSISEKYFIQSGCSNSIIRYTGEAQDIIPTLEEKFNLIFIDGDKRQYINLFNVCKDKLKINGYLLIDNVLWDGKVLQSNFDADTQVIHTLNRIIRGDTDFNHVILPVRDGITLAQRIK